MVFCSTFSSQQNTDYQSELKDCSKLKERLYSDKKADPELL